MKNNSYKSIPLGRLGGFSIYTYQTDDLYVSLMIPSEVHTPTDTTWLAYVSSVNTAVASQIPGEDTDSFWLPSVN